MKSVETFLAACGSYHIQIKLTVELELALKLEKERVQLKNWNFPKFSRWMDGFENLFWFGGVKESLEN